MNDYSSGFTGIRPTEEDGITPVKILTFREFMSIMRKRMWLLATTVFLAAAISAWMISSVTPLYVAGGQLLLGEQGRNDQASELQEGQLLSSSVIQGELAILRSSALLDRVAQKLDLVNTPEFNAALRPVEAPSAISRFISQSITMAKDTVKVFLPTPPALSAAPEAETVDENADATVDPVALAASASPETRGAEGRAIRQLRGSIRVQQQGNSFVVSVNTFSPNPEMAAAISNTLMTEYISFIADKRFDAAERFANFLEGRVADLAETLEASEREALAYQAVIESDADSSARVDQQMRELTTKLVDARAELAGARARTERVRQIRDTEGEIAAADVLTSDLILDLRTQRAQLRADLINASRVFGETSPQYSSIQRSMEALEADLTTEVQRTILQLGNNVETLDSNVTALEGILRRLEGLILERSSEQIRLNQLTKVAEANRTVYEDFLGRYKQTSEIKNLQNDDAEVLAYAVPPLSPGSPNKKVTVVLSSIGGLLVGLSIVFFLELMPTKLENPRDLSSYTRLANLGSLPSAIKSKNPQRMLQNAISRPNGKIAQSAQVLLRNIDLHAEGSVKSIVVTGGESGGAKSNLALLMAWSIAQSGKSCLLIDADIRTASLSRALGADPKFDLTKLLYGQIPWNKAVYNLPAYRINMLSTSAIGSDPAMVFASNNAGAIFEQAINSFDAVIIDAPALSDPTDVCALPLKIDLGIFMASIGKTAVADLNEQIQLFSKFSLQDSGAVAVEGSRLRFKT